MKNTIRQRGLALLFSIALLGGCVDMQVGQPIDRGNVGQLRPGRTKKAKVLELFGPPLRTVTGTNNEIAVYRYLDGEGACQELIISYYQDKVSAFSSQ